MVVSNFIKRHEKIIKKCLKILDVNPTVLYGKDAKNRMSDFVPCKRKWRNANGYYNPPENEVYIFKDKISNHFIIGALAHELRHVYQYQCKPDDFNFVDGKHFYTLKDKYYSCRKTELDANTFAYQYCRDNNLDEEVMNHYKVKKENIEKNRNRHKHECP